MIEATPIYVLGAPTLMFVGGVILFAFLVVFGMAALYAKLYRKVEQGKALIINKPNKTEVTFQGALVIPILHRAELMEISVKTIEIDRRGKEGLICKDNIRADIKVTFFVRVNKKPEDVLKVAQSVGCQRASDQEKLEELFNAKFSEALKTVGKQLEFEELYEKRDDFRDNIVNNIGEDLNGYVLEDAAIDFLEQTPVSMLDENNVLDSRGIKKITELTVEQQYLTSERRNAARRKTKRDDNETKREIGKDDLETKTAMLDFERRESEAEAKNKRAIAEIEATEGAEAEKKRQTARQLKEEARLEAEQKIRVREINKQREEESADKERERVLAIKNEEVEKERALQRVEREREVALREEEKKKQLETKRKEIADTVRERVAVERTVAEEEERINELRLVSEAERNKKASVIQAEAEAETQLVEKIKAAEASEEVAKFKAREKVVMADAELDSADRIAKAKQRLAEGVQAETAAPGLAEVKVQEAEAGAIEKRGIVEAKVLEERMNAEARGKEEQGMVEIRLKQSEAEAIEKEGSAKANVTRMQLEAEAEGEEKQGMARARVKEAEAAALEKEGEAQANVTRNKMSAEAEGEEKQGLARAKVKEAEAAALEKEGMAEAKALAEKLQAEALGIEKKATAEATGVEKKHLAEATGIEKKLLAEAEGLSKKAEAMKMFDERSRDHEEFRLQLEHDETLGLERIRNQVQLAKAQAEVMSEAFKAADIQIVGGDDGFYERFLGAISVGKTVEGFVDQSPTVRRVVDRALDGSPGANGGGSTLLQMLDSLKDEAGDDRKDVIQSIIDQVRDAGLQGDIAQTLDVQASQPAAEPKEPAE
jgi:uncharacterized membrane protein YqiK